MPTLEAAVHTAPRFRAPARFRASGPRRGLRASTVDRENRVITGYAVITRGEALGHGIWVDDVMLDQTVAAGNVKPNGAKTRFTHPGLCSDGLGKYLGRSKNFRRDGDIVRADLHFAAAASKSPEMDQDPVEYLMDMAEEDPEAFAASIIFWRDYGAEDRFVAEHEDKDGKFVSPDPANKRNYIHGRLAKLDASDIVDESAANPGGFFSRGEETAAKAESLLSWIFGVSDIEPDPETLGGGQPSRVREFVEGFMDRHGLKVVPNEQAVPGKESHVADETKPEKGDPMQAAREQFAAQLAALKAAFPADEAFAVKCAADGCLDVDAASVRYLAVVQEQLVAERKVSAELKAKAEALAAENAGIKAQLLTGEKPVDHGVTPQPKSFKALIEVYKAEHKDCSAEEAIRMCALTNPALYDAVTDD